MYFMLQNKMWKLLDLVLSIDIISSNQNLIAFSMMKRAKMLTRI